LLQRRVLPDALPRTRRNAASRPRLRAAIHRLEHGLDDRRVRFRVVAAHLPDGGRQVHPRRRTCTRQAVGGFDDARMDAALAGAISLVRDTAGRQVVEPSMSQSTLAPMPRDPDRDARVRAANRRTGLILLAISLLFFF